MGFTPVCPLFSKDITPEIYRMVDDAIRSGFMYMTGAWGMSCGKN